MKKFKLFMLALLLFAFAIPMVNAEGETGEKSEINIYIFKREGCSFCASALSFFESIEEEYGAYFNLVKYDVSDTANAELMDEAAEYFGVTAEGVPFIIIGSEYYPGFIESWGDGMKAQIMAEYKLSDSERTDVIKILESGNKPSDARNKKILIVSVVGLVGVIGFVTFARRDVEVEVQNAKTNYPSKKSVVEKVEVEAEDEDEEEVVVEKKSTKSTKKQETSKKEVKDTKKKASTSKKKTATSNKKKKN